MLQKKIFLSYSKWVFKWNSENDGKKYLTFDKKFLKYDILIFLGGDMASTGIENEK